MASPVQTVLIGEWRRLENFNHLFPAGSKALIARRVDDSKSNKSVYQGIIFNELTKTCMDVTFDVRTLKHVDYDYNNPFCPYNVSLVELEMFS